MVGSEWWAIDLLYSQSSRAVHITLPYHTNKQARAADQMVGCLHKGIRRHAVHTTLPYHTNKQARAADGGQRMVGCSHSNSPSRRAYKLQHVLITPISKRALQV